MAIFFVFTLGSGDRKLPLPGLSGGFKSGLMSQATTLWLFMVNRNLKPIYTLPDIV